MEGKKISLVVTVHAADVRPASYHEMLADTVAYLDSAELESAHIVGFSDGVIVGLLLASKHPERALARLYQRQPRPCRAEARR